MGICNTFAAWLTLDGGRGCLIAFAARRTLQGQFSDLSYQSTLAHELAHIP